MHYPSVLHLLREIKGIGARNVTHGRPRHLMGKQRLTQLIAQYDKMAEGGKIPSSYVVIYGYGRKFAKI